MHINNIETAKREFKNLEQGLFECCYVNHSQAEATYALSLSSVGPNDVVWYRTVDILTGEVKKEGCSTLIDKLSNLKQAIGAHYTPDYIRRDAIILACEFAKYASDYIVDGENVLHCHVVFGQSVHGQDVDELRGKTCCGNDFCI